MATFITKSGSKAIIQTATTRYAVKTVSFFWNADINVIRIGGKTMPDIVLLYSDLRINGVQPVSQTDAHNKLSILFPDTAGAINKPAAAAVVNAGKKRYWGVHVVVSLFRHVGDIPTFVQQQKDAGINLLWMHPDDYDPSDSLYKSNILDTITACEAIGGIWVAVGLMNLNDTGATTGTMKCKNIITDTIYRDGILKIDGKPAYFFYNYRADSPAPATFNQLDLNDLLLTDEGIRKTDWLLIADTQFPYSYDNGATWQGETTGARGVKRWSISGFKGVKPGVAPDYTITPLDKLFAEWTSVDGTAVFGVDMSQTLLQATNKYKTQFANRRRLAGGAWAGISGFYASASYWDFGYAGIAAIMKDITDMPVDERPLGINWATANDDVEYSRGTPLPGFVNGIRYLPAAGTYLGATVPTPLVDRRGMSDFIKPRIDALLNNQQTPVWLTNEIFCWYLTHPKNVGFTATIPAAMVTAGYIQSQWDSMIYKVGSTRVTNIKTIAGVDNIQMAAHLIQPAYLRINGTISTLLQPGEAFFEIAMGSFSGLPFFEIVAADGATVLAAAYGELAISQTTSWPGGWAPYAKKLVNTIS